VLSVSIIIACNLCRVEVIVIALRLEVPATETVPVCPMRERRDRSPTTVATARRNDREVVWTSGNGTIDGTIAEVATAMASPSVMLIKATQIAAITTTVAPALLAAATGGGVITDAQVITD
jgi:hypothetical protein